jgi:hypothetical protein
MKLRQYYKLKFEPDEKKNSSGIVYFPKTMNMFWAHDGREITIDISDMIFPIKDGEFADLLSANLTLRIYSLKLRTIIDSFLTSIDNPKWIPIKIQTEDSAEIREYFILHFGTQPDVLDYEKTRYADAKRKIITKAMYDVQKIGDRHIFTYKEYGNLTIVSAKLRKAIIDASCSGIYFYDVLSPGKLV